MAIGRKRVGRLIAFDPDDEMYILEHQKRIGGGTFQSFVDFAVKGEIAKQKAIQELNSKRKNKTK